MTRHNDLNLPVIALVGLVGTLVTLIAIIGAQVLYYHTAERQHERKVIQVPTSESDSLVAEQEVKLMRLGWLDREKKLVAIPIDRAMDFVVREQSATQDKERSHDK